jgi:hypothetical protein
MAPLNGIGSFGFATFVATLLLLSEEFRGRSQNNIAIRRVVFRGSSCMAEEVSKEIRGDLDRARVLHDRAVSDYAKCAEFSELMSNVLLKLEDDGCYRTADKVMTVLLDCNPKEGAHCEKATLVGDRVRKLCPRPCP